MRLAVWFFALAMGFGIPASAAAAETGGATAAFSQTAEFAPGQDATWEKFTEARRVFQVRLGELAVKRWPEYADFFTAHRDLQLAYIERRGLVFYYFLRNDPSRIVRDKGGDEFLNFSWSPEEDSRFRNEIPGYAGLSDEIARFKSRSDKLKNHELLADRYERLEIDPEYLALMRETMKIIVEAERELAAPAAASQAPALSANAAPSAP